MDKLFGTVALKKIVILGFAFKSDTNDTRESPAISIVRDLLENGAEIIINDPKVNASQIARDLNLKENLKNLDTGIGSWRFSKEPYEAVKNVDAVLILTEWDEYKKLDWQRISKLMRKPSWVFDARSVANIKEMQNQGLNVWSVGNGSLN